MESPSRPASPSPPATTSAATPLKQHSAATAVPAHQSHSPAVLQHHDSSVLRPVPVVGDPSVAGGISTPTGRGNILLPASPSLPQHATAVPFSPAPAVQPTGSPVLSPSVVPLEDPLDIFSRPSPAKSRPASRAPSPSSARVLSSHSADPLAASTSSSVPASPLPVAAAASPIPSLAISESALFERDVEHTNEHLLTGSEALDLASAPVLDEVAQAVSDEVPILPETLPLPLPLPLSSASQTDGNSPRSSILPLSASIGGPSTHPASIGSALEQLSLHDISEQGVLSTPEKPRALSFGSGHRGRSMEVSPPPSLSLSASASGSPSSSSPASPITAMHAVSGNTVPQYPAPVVYGKTDSANEEQPRRLSFVSYADIINSERLPASQAQLEPSGSSSALSLSSGLSTPSSHSPAHSLQPLSPASGILSSSIPAVGSDTSPSLPKTRRAYHPDRADSSETVTYARLRHGDGEQEDGPKQSTAGWGVLELGKSLAGSAAGLLSSVGLVGESQDDSTERNREMQDQALSARGSNTA